MLKKFISIIDMHHVSDALGLTAVAVFLLFTFMPQIFEIFRLEASPTSVDIYPSSENTNGSFAVKNLSGDAAPKIEALGTHDPSQSPTKAPYFQKVLQSFVLFLISLLNPKMLTNFFFWSLMLIFIIRNYVACDYVNSCFLIQGVSGGILLLADAEAETSGAKAAACGRLASLAAVSDKGNFYGGYDRIFF